MNRFIFFISLSLLLQVTPSFGKGHGGGHGHHSGGHARGSGGQSGGTHSAAGRSAAARTPSGQRRGVNQVNGFRPGTKYVITGPRNGIVTSPNNTYRPYEHWNSLPYYYYGYPPAYYYDPYFSMWSLGANLTYAPHYSAARPSDKDNLISEENLDGFVVFEYDTIKGNITIKSGAIFLETADSAHAYDYKFKWKQTGLKYVTVYNDDDKELNLVRLKQDNKKLWRVIHQGKMNLYDERHDFIYNPEDIDANTLMIVYNGEATRLHSSSRNVIKQRLTAFVNKAYGTNLNPNDFTLNQLFLYIDKLD